MAPVCVRVAFLGGGPGEPSRWADRYSLRCACDTEAGIVAMFMFNGFKTG